MSALLCLPTWGPKSRMSTPRCVRRYCLLVVWYSSGPHASLLLLLSLFRLIPLSFLQDGVTAVHLAAQMNHSKCLSLLLQFNADACAKDHVRAWCDVAVAVWSRVTEHRCVVIERSHTAERIRPEWSPRVPKVTPATLHGCERD